MLRILSKQLSSLRLTFPASTNTTNLTRSISNTNTLQKQGPVVGVTWWQGSHNKRGRGFRRKKSHLNLWLRTRDPVADETDASDARVDLTEESREFVGRTLAETDERLMRELVSPLREPPALRNVFTVKPATRRTGLLALKIGEQSLYTKAGKAVRCTLLQVLDCHVVAYLKAEDMETSPRYNRWWYYPDSRVPRYDIAIVGAISADRRKFHDRYLDLFKKTGMPPKQHLTRFIVTPNAEIAPGTPLSVNHFRVGDFVDCSSKTIDHGFQGPVTRWGFRGMPKTHGTTKSHRKHGSLGGGEKKTGTQFVFQAVAKSPHARYGKRAGSKKKDSGGVGVCSGVWKGKRMAGHMGAAWRVQKGAEILRINTKYNVLYVKGASVPGLTHTMVRVYDTVLNHRRLQVFSTNPPPMPTFYALQDPVYRPTAETLADGVRAAKDFKKFKFSSETARSDPYAFDETRYTPPPAFPLPAALDRAHPDYHGVDPEDFTDDEDAVERVKAGDVRMSKKALDLDVFPEISEEPADDDAGKTVNKILAGDGVTPGGKFQPELEDDGTPRAARHGLPAIDARAWKWRRNPRPYRPPVTPLMGSHGGMTGKPDIYHPDIFDFSEPSIVFKEEEKKE